MSPQRRCSDDESWLFRLYLEITNVITIIIVLLFQEPTKLG